jgi:uncharacterized protein (DUF2252 family)
MGRRALLLSLGLTVLLSGCQSHALTPVRPAPAIHGQSAGSVTAQVRADNERRRTANPEGHARKLAKLTENPFSFFRGTTPLFYRRLFAALPADLRDAPRTIVHGDLHLENFSVLPAGAGVTYGLDDFDESLSGPASIDLVRALASIVVAYGEDDRLLEAFLDGYRKGTDGRMHVDSEPIQTMLKKKGKVTQADMLAKRTLPTRPRQLKPDKALKALSPAQKRDLQQAIQAARLPGLANLPFADGAQRFAGTASLDLFRYEAVIGPGSDQDQIIEVKELLPPVLGQHLGSAGDDGERYRQALRQYQGEAALPVATTTLGAYRMLVRYRPACKDTVSPEDVGPKDRLTFLTDLGKITGQAHARGGQGQALAGFVTTHGRMLLQTGQAMGRQSLDDFKAYTGGQRR